MTNRDKGPPNYRRAKCCLNCKHCRGRNYHHCDKYTIKELWNGTVHSVSLCVTNICDDYEPEAGQGGEG